MGLQTTEAIGLRVQRYLLSSSPSQQGSKGQRQTPAFTAAAASKCSSRYKFHRAGTSLGGNRSVGHGKCDFKTPELSQQTSIILLNSVEPPGGLLSEGKQLR